MCAEGLCILCEAGLLPGALIENIGTKFISEDETLLFDAGSGLEEIILPIAHKEGCFWLDNEALFKVRANNMAIIKYKNNPNGSIDDIAGLYDRENKVFGLMPHPERAVLKSCSDAPYLKDGVKIFEFIRVEILSRFSNVTKKVHRETFYGEDFR